MSDGFVKIYGHKLLRSTLWDESAAVRIAFIGMLSEADAKGFVRVPSERGLARILNLSADEVREALDVLEAPDGDSSSEEAGGRRILRVQGGWQVVNYTKYREKREESGPPKVAKPTLVYFARSGDAIKIGCSQNPWSRLTELRTGSPVGVELIATMPGSFELEKQLHLRFAKLRINREWFRADDELVAYVATVAATELATAATKDSRSQLQQEADLRSQISESEREGERASAPPAPEFQSVAADLVPDNEQHDASGVFARGDTALLVRQFHSELLSALGTFPSQSHKTAEAYAALTNWANQAPDPKHALQLAFWAFREDSWATEKRYPIGALANNPEKYHSLGMELRGAAQ